MSHGASSNSAGPAAQGAPIEEAWLDGARVLVTGATGRVGRRLADRLLATGARVSTVVLPEDDRAGELPGAVEVVVGSLSDPEVVANAVDGVQAVVHLAALMDWSADANDRLFASNVASTYLLLDRVARLCPDIARVVLASSDEVYPALEVVGEITEELPSRPYSFYGLTKQLDEVIADFYHRAHGLPISVGRFSLTAESSEIARHDGWSGRLFFASGLRSILDAVGRPEAVATIDANIVDQRHTLLLARDADGIPYRFQFCDARDLVEGLICLLTRPGAVGQVCNLSGPAPFDYEVVVPRLAKALGIEFVDLRLPGPRIEVVTSTERARAVAGFAPGIGIDEILDELVRAGVR